MSSRDGWCVHFTGISAQECKAGHCYTLLMPEYQKPSFGQMVDKLPCFKRNQTDITCQDQRFPTPEEIAEREVHTQKRIQMTITARTAITDYLKANGQPLRRVQGHIPCPHCSGTLSFSIASNGHCHARCSTSGCVNWME